MKTLKKVLDSLTLCLAFVFALGLASCSNANAQSGSASNTTQVMNSNVTKAYADSINKAATDNKHVTYNEAKTALGKECNDWTLGGSGVMFAVRGYDSLENEEAFNKLVAGGDEKTVYQAILITCNDGKCVKALYVEGSGEEVSRKLADAIQ